MKNLNLILSGILAFTAAGILSAGSVPPPVPQKAEKSAPCEAGTFKPVLSGDVIVCGNKKTVWARNGQIKISNGDGVLLTIYPYYLYKNDQKKVDWSPFTPALCQVKTEGAKVVWTFKKKLGDQIYDAGTQTLEITPEGLLKVRCNITVIQAPGWQPWRKTGEFFFFLPFSRTDGAELVFNGSRKKLDSGKKVILYSGNAKKFHYVFYPGNPENVIEMNAEKPETGTTTCYPDKFNKAFRIVLTMNAQMSCTFTLDLRKGMTAPQKP